MRVLGIILVLVSVTLGAVETLSVEVGGSLSVQVPVVNGTGSVSLQFINIHVAGPRDFAAGDIRATCANDFVTISMTYPGKEGGSVPILLAYGLTVTIQASPSTGRGASAYQITVTGSTGGTGGGGSTLTPDELKAAGANGVFLEALESVVDPADPEVRNRYTAQRITGNFTALTPGQVEPENAAAMAAAAINWYQGFRAVTERSVFGSLGSQSTPNKVSVPDDGFGDCKPRSKDALNFSSVQGLQFYCSGILWTPGQAHVGGTREDHLGWYGKSLSMAAVHSMARSFRLCDAGQALVAAGRTAVGRGQDVDLKNHPLVMAMCGNTSKATATWARTQLHMSLQGYNQALGNARDEVREAQRDLDDAVQELLMVGKAAKTSTLRLPCYELERAWRRTLLMAVGNLARDLGELKTLEVSTFNRLMREGDQATGDGPSTQSFPDASRLATVDDVLFLVTQTRWCLLPDVTPPRPPSVPELALPSLRVRSGLLTIQWIIAQFDLLYGKDPASWPSRPLLGADQLPPSAMAYDAHAKAFLSFLGKNRDGWSDVVSAGLRTLEPGDQAPDQGAVIALADTAKFWQDASRSLTNQVWEETLTEVMKNRLVTIDSCGGNDTTLSKVKADPDDRFTVLPQLWRDTIARAIAKMRTANSRIAGIIDRENSAYRSGLDEKCALLAMAVGQSINEPYGLDLFQPSLRRDRIAWYRVASMLAMMTRLDAKDMIEHTRMPGLVSLTSIWSNAAGCDYRDVTVLMRNTRTILLGMLTLEADTQLLAGASARILTLLDRDMLYQGVRVQRRAFDLITTADESLKRKGGR